MIRFYVAIYLGKDEHFKRKQQYPIAVKRSIFSKKVQCYQRHGYHDFMQPGTLRTYATLEDFKQDWYVTQVDHPLPKSMRSGAPTTRRELNKYLKESK